MHTKAKIIPYSALPRMLVYWRLKEQKVVFTNGVFDLLHLGHVDYLERARSLGNVLVVGLNTDASVRRLKPGRPIQDEYARARCLAALQAVDAVVLFEQDTPLELIELIRPQVLVKGADYAVSQIVGADRVVSYGGRVESLALIEGYSTSQLIEKIRHT